MEFTHYNDQVAHTAADLVNTRGSTSGNESLTGVRDLRTFLRERNFDRPHEATDADLAALRTFREELRPIFHASSGAEKARLLNELLARLDVAPYLTDHDGTWHLHYVPEDSPVWKRVAAAVTMGLATTGAERGFDRLGVCHADGCEDVYVDTSRNRSRRYCNELCTTRMNVAAYRARHKTGSPRKG